MFLNSLFAAIAALTLSGCALTSPMVVKLKPPVELLQDCPVPEYRTVTNADIANGVLVLRSAIAQCNNDKAGLRAWSETNE